jgi:hypothetical protein
LIAGSLPNAGQRYNCNQQDNNPSHTVSPFNLRHWIRSSSGNHGSGSGQASSQELPN